MKRILATCISLISTSAMAVAPFSGIFVGPEGNTLTVSIVSGTQVATLARAGQEPVILRAPVELIGRNLFEIAAEGAEGNLTAHCSVFQIAVRNGSELKVTFTPPEASVCRDAGVIGDLPSYAGVFVKSTR